MEPTDEIQGFEARVSGNFGVVVDSGDAKVRRWLTAAHDDSHELAEQLLRENPNLITAVDDTYQRTALHWATKNGQLKMVEFLLKESVDLTNAVDNEGKTALHWAASKRKRALAVPPLLAANPASLHVRSTVGFTPLDIAILSKDPVVILAQFFAADPSLVHRAIDSEGRTVLHLAAKHNCPATVEHLLAMNQAELIKAVDSHGRTAFDIAVENNGWRAIIHFLAEDPSLISNVNYEGSSALHHAAEYGYAKAVTKLLAHDPGMIDVVDSDGKTALHWAATYGHKHIFTQLLSVASPAIINAASETGETALHCAACSGYFDIVEQLLDVMSPELIGAADRDGMTVLYYTATSMTPQDKLVARLLAMSPGLIDKVSSFGVTALHLGTRFASIMEMFLALRPEMVHAVDKNGNTVLHFALKQSTEPPKEVIERLVGLIPSALRAVNLAGQTPFDMSVRWCTILPLPTVEDTIMMKLNLDEVVSAFTKYETPNYEERFLAPAVARQCECLCEVLLPGVVGVVFEYLGLLECLRQQYKTRKDVSTFHF